MNAWSKTGNVRFRVTNGAGQVRIARGGGADGGYWSYLGTDILSIPLNEPTMNLEAFSMDTSESEFHRVVRHETGHTLGFPHEHMRRALVQLIDAKKAIAGGTMDASVAQFPAEMGRVAVESAVKVIRGETVPAQVKVRLELVTKDNVQ